MAGEKEQILPACSSSSKFFHNLILNVSHLCGGTSHLARVGTLRCTAMRTVFYKFNNALVFRFKFESITIWSPGTEKILSLC